MSFFVENCFPPHRHCEYPFRTETESVMTLVEESAMKQSTTGRHCEERSDEAIQKVVYFRIASSLPLPAMTTRRLKACYKDIAKSVIANIRFVPQLKRFDDAYFFYHKGTKDTKVSQRTVVRQPFVLIVPLR